MPAIHTKDLEHILEERAFERIVLKRNHGVHYMIIHVEDGPALIHFNKDGRPKEYRHAEQAREWLARTFRIADAEDELGAR